MPPRELQVESSRLEAPRIDIQRAPWYEWTLLEGVGEARARRIVEFREARGGFASIDDLREVPGLPGDWLERARPFLELGR